jgi:hypothetical protein
VFVSKEPPKMSKSPSLSISLRLISKAPLMVSISCCDPKLPNPSVFSCQKKISPSAEEDAISRSPSPSISPVTMALFSELSEISRNGPKSPIPDSLLYHASSLVTLAAD